METVKKDQITEYKLGDMIARFSPQCNQIISSRRQNCRRRRRKKYFAARRKNFGHLLIGHEKHKKAQKLNLRIKFLTG